MRSSTARWVAPLKSTAWPPGRSAGARSTTVTVQPKRVSHQASAGPATLAPEIRTVRFFMPPSFARAAYRSLAKR